MIRLIMFLLVPGLLFLAIACGDDDGDGDATPTSTVAPAETPTLPADGETSGADGFREFAATFQEALDDGDAAFLRGSRADRKLWCARRTTWLPAGQVARSASSRVRSSMGSP